MRLSYDDIDDNGMVLCGYDYNLQVWVKDGIIQDCGHPTEMKQQFCCNSHRLAGHRISEIQGHEERLKREAI